MEATTLGIDFNNTGSYKHKKIINIFKRVNDENIQSLVDSSVCEFISSLESDTIISLFRNSSPILQNRLWTNETVQKVLIFGQKDVINRRDGQVVINLENLNKILKSQSIKKQIYKNKYFISVIISDNVLDRRFFHCYDIKKIFENLVYSDQFKSLPVERQIEILEIFNIESDDVLLPVDFRKRYKNIERLLLSIDVKRLDESILSQLNDDELFFLDYIRKDLKNYNTIKKYIIDNIKTNGKSFEEFMNEMEERGRLVSNRIYNAYKRFHYSYSTNFMDKIYEILLHEISDEVVKEKLLRYLLPKIMKNTTVSAEEMYNTLKRNLDYNILNYSDVWTLAEVNNDIDNDLRLMFYIKFNISLTSARYLNGITLDQLSKINIKHINKLFKYLEDKNQDELSSIYGICIKMYFIFGYERSIEILSGKYGEYDKKFLDNIAKTDVSGVLMIEEGNKYLPTINRKFISFMFENPKSNHFIDMLNNKESELYKRWYYFYNNYDEILEKCHNEITIKKIISILETEAYDVNKKVITPDCYLLNNNDFLENIVLGNKSGHSNDEVLRKIVEIYKKMKKRIESSIPYVEGTSTNGYKYQTLKFDDYRIFELGYKANCCIRTLDIAHKHLLHAALCRNGRMLLINDENGNLMAFCPIKRNGNVLIVNSIEYVIKDSPDTDKLIINVFSECIQEIVNVSLSSNEPIELVCIGRKSVLKPKVVEFPPNIKTPTIYEKDDEVYKDTDQYHRELDIVYKANNFNFKDIKNADPGVSYKDPRPSITFCDFHKSSDEERTMALKAIDAIRYTNYETDELENYQLCDKYIINCCIYNKDWYILEAYDGNIYGEYLKDDERAINEYNVALQEFQNKYKSEQKNEGTLVKKFDFIR